MVVEVAETTVGVSVVIAGDDDFAELDERIVADDDDEASLEEEEEEEEWWCRTHAEFVEREIDKK